MNLCRPASLVALLFLFGGCLKVSRHDESAGDSDEESVDLTPEESAAATAARPFVDAIVARDYPKAFAQLSSHGRARMSPNQFNAPQEHAEAVINESRAVTNPTVQQFAGFMRIVEEELGAPSKLIFADSVETDDAILAGKGDGMETAFTIGNMPESIPSAIRKAAIRAQIGVKLSAKRLQEAAAAQEITVAELQADEDFEPYLNIKVVMVEEGGKLAVGYFEFTPPSMWD